MEYLQIGLVSLCLVFLLLNGAALSKVYQIVTAIRREQLASNPQRPKVTKVE